MLNVERHRQVLFNLITEIYKSPAGMYLGFKGGTMFYFFHELDRFSVDLDFNLLDSSKKDAFQVPPLPYPVENMQVAVGQQRRNHATLRRDFSNLNIGADTFGNFKNLNTTD